MLTTWLIIQKEFLYLEKRKQKHKMSTLKEVKEFFENEGTQHISSEAAGYQFVKRKDGSMFQFSEGEYKFYDTLDGLAKAALYRIKRG